MTLTSSLKRFALAAAAAAATAWVGAPTPAEAQYYGRPAYGQPVYVPPKVLRKQREMQRRVIQKYGYPAPAYGYRAPVYRQPQVYRQQQFYRQPPAYAAPVYRQPRPYGYDPREQRYRIAPGYGYGGPAPGQPGYNLPIYGDRY